MKLLSELEASIKSKIGTLDAAAQRDILDYFDKVKVALGVHEWYIVGALIAGFVVGRLV